MRLKLTSFLGSGGREHIVNYTPSMKPIDLVSNEMKFFVDVRDIHHHLDFKFVRLVLQITETMKVLTEQKRYAQKNKDSVTSEKGILHSFHPIKRLCFMHNDYRSQTYIELRDTVPNIQAGRASDGAEILSFFGILSVLMKEIRSPNIFPQNENFTPNWPFLFLLNFDISLSSSSMEKNDNVIK